MGVPADRRGFYTSSKGLKHPKAFISAVKYGPRLSSPFGLIYTNGTSMRGSMALPRRTLLIVLGSLVALILLIVIAIPLFLNADAFRTRIETALTSSLGRKVTLGKLDISILTGSLV